MRRDHSTHTEAHFAVWVVQLCIITCDVAREKVGWRVMHATGSRILLNRYHEFCIFLLFYVCCTISYCNQNLSCFNVNDSPPHTHTISKVIFRCALCSVHYVKLYVTMFVEHCTTCHSVHFDSNWRAGTQATLQCCLSENIKSKKTK